MSNLIRKWIFKNFLIVICTKLPKSKTWPSSHNKILGFLVIFKDSSQFHKIVKIAKFQNFHGRKMCAARTPFISRNINKNCWRFNKVECTFYLWIIHSQHLWMMSILHHINTKFTIYMSKKYKQSLVQIRCLEIFT